MVAIDTVRFDTTGRRIRPPAFTVRVVDGGLGTLNGPLEGDAVRQRVLELLDVADDADHPPAISKRGRTSTTVSSDSPSRDP
jgi:hypothetical protein